MAARDEVTTRVQLDTTPAQSQLRGLVKEAETTQGRVSAGIKNAVKGGLKATGLGVGIGAGVSAVRGATSSGVGAVIGEALGGIGEQFAQLALGEGREKARASIYARNMIIDGVAAQGKGFDQVRAKALYDNIAERRLPYEQAASMIRADANFRSGGGMEDIIDRIMGGLVDALRDAVDYFWSLIPSMGSSK